MGGASCSPFFFGVGSVHQGQAMNVLLCFLLSVGTLLGPAYRAGAQERTGKFQENLQMRAEASFQASRSCLQNQRSQRVVTVITDGSGGYRADLEPGMYPCASSSAGSRGKKCPISKCCSGANTTSTVPEGRQRQRGRAGNGRARTAHRCAQHDHRAQRDRRRN